MTEPATTRNAASDQELLQLEEIHSGWIETRSRTPRRVWGEDSALGNARGMGLLIALYLGVLCIFPDFVLTSPATSPEPSFVHHVDGLRLAAVLVLLSLLNGFLLDLALADQTGGKPLRPWVRALRFLTCSVAPLGLAVPGLWYQLWRKRRDRLERHEGTRPILARARFHVFLAERITTVGHRFLVLEWTYFWVLLSNLILPFAGIFWLSNPVEMTGGRYAAIVAASAVAHLTAFAGVSYFFAGLRREQTAKWSRWLLAVLPLFWLVPVPMVFFLGLLPLVLVRTSRGEGTLAAAAHAGRDSVDRLSTWRNLEAALSSRWSEMPWRRRLWPAGGVERPATPGVEQTRLLWLYKGKSAVLLFDTIACAGLLGAFREQLPTVVGGAEWMLGAAGLVALAVGGIALAVQLVAVVLRMTRSETRLRVLDDHPYAFYLGVTQLVFFMGCLIGESLQRGKGEPIAGLLLVAGLLGMLAEFAKIVLPVPERIRQAPAELVLWMVLFFSMGVTGLGMMRDPKVMAAWTGLLAATARLYPVMSVLLGGLLAGWLLRPFAARQIFDRELPARRRLLLAVLTLSALLPLGGLFVPLWIYVRHRVEPWCAETGGSEMVPGASDSRVVG